MTAVRCHTGLLPPKGSTELNIQGAHSTAGRWCPWLAASMAGLHLGVHTHDLSSLVVSGWNFLHESQRVPKMTVPANKGKVYPFMGPSLGNHCHFHCTLLIQSE